MKKFNSENCDLFAAAFLAAFFGGVFLYVGLTIKNLYYAAPYYAGAVAFIIAAFSVVYVALKYN